MRRSQRGYTLIELLLVVAIIGILASIALPAFQQYRFRTRTAETGTMLGNIRLSEETFIAAYDNYAVIAVPNPNPAGPAGPAGVYKRGWERRPCPAGCTRQNSAACTEFSCIGFESATTVYYHYAVNAVAVGAGAAVNEYAIGGQGDVDGDGVMSVSNIQSANTGGAVGVAPDPFGVCIPLPPAQIISCTPMIF